MTQKDKVQLKTWRNTKVFIEKLEKKGLQLTFLDGHEKGYETVIAIAKKLLQQNMPIEQITLITGLSVQQIIDLQEKDF